MFCSKHSVVPPRKTAAVFIDRDGVINELIYHKESGVIDSPFTVRHFRLLPGVGEAIRILNDNQIKTVIISNQPGVAKKHMTLAALNAISRKMEKEIARYGGAIDSIYYCLHHPEAVDPEYRKACRCRKPAPGLILKAARELSIDPKNSYMIGDNLSDIKAGKAAGCRTILIGKQKCELCHMMHEEDAVPDFIIENLLQATELIIDSQANSNFEVV
jgi:D-glycero-D-manno-heptose 1,7-bisphosphate phosphatase